METENKNKSNSQKIKTLIAQEKAMISISRYIDFLYYISIITIVIGLFVLVYTYGNDI